MKSARTESGEREHFNRLNAEGGALCAYRPDLHDHPDYRILLHGIARLGPLENRSILLLGCGIGREVWFFVAHGARVIAVDIAFNSVRRALCAAREYGFITGSGFYVGSAYGLGIRSESVDLIYGHAILHHLEEAAVAAELSRVLKPGGVAVFTEPLDANPMLRFVRNHVPYPGKHRVVGEEAMSYRRLRDIGKAFGSFEFHEIELTAMIGRVLRIDALTDMLYGVDTFALRYLPFLRPLCRAVTCIYRL